MFFTKNVTSFFVSKKLFFKRLSQFVLKICVFHRNFENKTEKKCFYQKCHLLFFRKKVIFQEKIALFRSWPQHAPRKETEDVERT